MRKRFNKLKKCEEIEEYYLNVIARYVGADINGLICRLESHNKTWKYWYPKKGDRKSLFDVGSERVTYMLLSRGDILGEPNANPIGSDCSFLKYDEAFNHYIAINIDVKSIRANTNLLDIINNIPVGINQNSYSCLIEYKHGRRREYRKYTPGLDTSYNIEVQHGFIRNYLTLTYELVILYEQKPNSENPEREEVIGIFLICIPNGLLYLKYGDTVFSPGKSGNLHLVNGQKFDTYDTSGKINGVYTTGDDDNIDTLIRNKCCKDKNEYYDKFGDKNIKWKNLDARFNYTSCSFEFLDNKKRIVKLYLNENRLEYFFCHIDSKGNYIENGIKRTKIIKNGYEDLIKLPTT